MRKSTRSYCVSVALGTSGVRRRARSSRSGREHDAGGCRRRRPSSFGPERGGRALAALERWEAPHAVVDDNTQPRCRSDIERAAGASFDGAVRAPLCEGEVKDADQPLAPVPLPKATAMYDQADGERRCGGGADLRFGQTVSDRATRRPLSDL